MSDLLADFDVDNPPGVFEQVAHQARKQGRNPSLEDLSTAVDLTRELMEKVTQDVVDTTLSLAVRTADSAGVELTEHERMAIEITAGLAIGPTVMALRKYGLMPDEG